MFPWKSNNVYAALCFCVWKLMLMLVSTSVALCLILRLVLTNKTNPCVLGLTYLHFSALLLQTSFTADISIESTPTHRSIFPDTQWRDFSKQSPCSNYFHSLYSASHHPRPLTLSAPECSLGGTKICTVRISLFPRYWMTN